MIGKKRIEPRTLSSLDDTTSTKPPPQPILSDALDMIFEAVSKSELELEGAASSVLLGNSELLPQPVAVAAVAVIFSVDGIGVGMRVRTSPLPPNRTCGSPASGSPVSAFTPYGDLQLRVGL